MKRLSVILLSFSLFYVIFNLSGCLLDTSGLAPVSIHDPNFHGCYQRPADPSELIVIMQESVNLLRGTGRGLIGETNKGWSFSGQVTAERVAILHVTMEGEPGFDVDISRPMPDPPDDLTMQRQGSPSLILTRCP